LFLLISSPLLCGRLNLVFAFGDDGLIFARKVFVQQLRESVAGNFAYVFGGIQIQPFDSSFE
jgi:hypothetical protein